jgi:putative peptide zinc metalloprotease protein
MLAVRPTFSESWYRVKNLKAKLRSSAQISRQFYRGDRWYVVRDPAGNQYHRLSDAAYRFVGLLDGTRTVQEAWDLVGGQLADDAPTQPEVIQILTHLYSANLIDADVTPDATVLLRRQKKQQQRKLQGRLMNALFPRIPVWDPDRFLVRWMPVVRHLFSKMGAVVWLITIIAALAVIAPQWQRVTSAAAHSIDMTNNTVNAFWLWLVFVLIKFIHELGHAFACRRFGGECHEMGIMFLVFIPTPYVDASTAWSFPNKWHRIFVGAAGMIVEMYVAALCAFLWIGTDSNSLVNQLAYNAMLVASVTTVVFNANPLLRYDGYYILSDLLEIPNLRQKSSEYALGLIKRHVFRVKQQQPLPSIRQRVELFTYAITSTIYRTFVGIIIILVVTWQVPVLGVLMALGGLITWLVVPSSKLFKYLALEPELHRKRGRATAFCAAVVVASVVLVGIIPFWRSIDQKGIIEPSAKLMVIPEASGVVTEIVARDGQDLRKGDVILRMTDVETDAKLREQRAMLESLRERLRKSAATDQAQYKIDKEALDATLATIAYYEKQKASLDLRAPMAGKLVAPELDKLQGVYLQRGQNLGQVSAPGQLVVRAALEQRDYEVLRAEAALGAGTFNPDGSPIEVRPAGRVGTVVKGVSLKWFDSVQPELPHESLGQAGGDDIPVDPQDRTGKRPLVPQFEARITLAATDADYLPGQRATVRFKLEKAPLIVDWTRRFLQLIRTHQTDKWI